jgi:hypothetical protein
MDHEGIRGFSRMMLRLGHPALRLQLISDYAALDELMRKETEKPNCPKWYKKCYRVYREKEDGLKQEAEDAFQRAKSILNYDEEVDVKALNEEDFDYAGEMLVKSEAATAVGETTRIAVNKRFRDTYDERLKRFKADDDEEVVVVT